MISSIPITIKSPYKHNNEWEPSGDQNIGKAIVISISAWIDQPVCHPKNSLSGCEKSMHQSVRIHSNRNRKQSAESVKNRETWLHKQICSNNVFDYRDSPSFSIFHSYWLAEYVKNWGTRTVSINEDVIATDLLELRIEKKYQTLQNNENIYLKFLY